MSMHIAVIGGGAAGLAAAHALAGRHRVTLYEQADQLGGHAHTVLVEGGPDAGTPLDVGFMVLNDRNYPHLQALLQRLPGVSLGPSEMSFSYHAEGGPSYGLNWNEPLGADRPAPPMLAEIVRFMRQATRDLAAGSLGETTLGDWVEARGFSEALVEGYMLPMGAAIWSAEPQGLRGCPAAFVLGFYHNHGMLSLRDGPRWQHVRGGSHTYVAAIRAALGDQPVRVGLAARRVWRSADHVRVEAADGAVQSFDALILAPHADEALALLADPSDAERGLLGAWRYQPNHAVLHTDTTLMPPDARNWAAWNFAWAPGAVGRGPTVTYHLNRLQGLDATQFPYFLTLNPPRPIAPGHVLKTFDFMHPVYTAEAVATQPALKALGADRRTRYAGSYMGYGFHEDAVRAGLEAAASLEALPC